jgi:hypothetical protein
MRPETITQARIARRAACARELAEIAALAMYVLGRSIIAQRTAAAVIQSRVLRSLTS